MLLIIIASVLFILLIVGLVWSIKTTPENLSGFYGFKYFLIGTVALAAIVVMYGYGIMSILS